MNKINIMDSTSSLKKKAKKLDAFFAQYNGYQPSPPLISVRSTKVKYKLPSLKIDPVSFETGKFPFNKTKTFKEGKNRIMIKQRKKEQELHIREEKILDIFQKSSENLGNLINPEMMKDNDVIKALRKNKRSFGVLKNESSQKILSQKDLSSNFTKSMQKRPYLQVMSPRISFEYAQYSKTTTNSKNISPVSKFIKGSHLSKKTADLILKNLSDNYKSEKNLRRSDF